MKKLERQTAFTLKELFDLLGRKDHGYPHYMLINEVGTILKNGEDEDNAAENYLVSILNHKDDNSRAIAFTYLSSIKEIADKHSAVLAKFRTEPKNKFLISSIDEALKTEEFLA